MNKQQIIAYSKVAAMIIFVPTIITAGYYGYKAYKHYRNKKKNENDSDNKEEEAKEAKEAKVIPLNTFKPEIKATENNTEKTEKQA